MPSFEDLERKAVRVRRNIIRMLCEAGSGHPGGSLSEVEILVVLYSRILRHFPSDPENPDRDRFLLSKGHGVPALYAVLAEEGYIDPASLMTLRKIESPLEGHPDRRKVPGIEISSGSLGQGVSIGAGMALGARLAGANYDVHVLVGDGECQEGQIWEAALFAGRHAVSNLTVVVDNNGFQLDAATKDILDLEPFRAKWESFGWAVREVDGHDFAALIEAYEWASSLRSGPKVIIASTVKGKGVSFMENNNEYHGVAPTPEEAKRALDELNAIEAAIGARAAEGAE